MSDDGIVIELEKELLDESISLEVLLRKSYLVAKKLKLKEFENWIEQEQSGFKGEIPEYRKIGGEIKAYNPQRGWIPVVVPAKVEKIIAKMPIGNPISYLIDVYNSSENSVILSVNSSLTEWLNGNTDFIPTKFIFVSSKSEFYRIMSTVRNKILEWALLLEENGIIGEGITFTEDEKEKAVNTSVINNFVNNFYAQASDINIDQG